MRHLLRAFSLLLVLHSPILAQDDPSTLTQNILAAVFQVPQAPSTQPAAQMSAPVGSTTPTGMDYSSLFTVSLTDGYTGDNWQTPGISATAKNSGSAGMKPIAYTSSGVAYTADYAKLKAEITTPVQASNYIKENLGYAYIPGTAGMDPAKSDAEKVTDCKTAARMITDLVSDDGWQGTIWGYEYADKPKNGHTIAVLEKPGVAAYLSSTYDIYSVTSLDMVWAIEKDRIGGTHTIGARNRFRRDMAGTRRHGSLFRVESTKQRVHINDVSIL